MEISLEQEWVAALALHAEQEAPRECCGLLYAHTSGEVEYLPCKNLATDPAGQFVLDPMDWAMVEDLGEIVAVCHSHPNASANPSMADRAMCERSGKPWFIIGWPSAVIKRVDPSGWQAPLVGREFHHGVLDCYTLIQDYFRITLGITLPDFEREDGWWERGGNLYRDGFAAAGFVEVNDEPREHDVLLMQVRADVENHGAVMLADGKILHHLHSRLSCRDIWGGYWQRHTRAVLRHQQLLGAPA